MNGEADGPLLRHAHIGVFLQDTDAAEWECDWLVAADGFEGFAGDERRMGLVAFHGRIAGRHNLINALSGGGAVPAERGIHLHNLLPGL